MTAERFPTLVELACHDVRTPLAAIVGFAKTMIRTGDLPEREVRFVGIIDEAAAQIVGLLDQLGLAARIESGRYLPAPALSNTLELAASSGDERIAADGSGAEIETDSEVARRSLAGLALATLRFGELPGVHWAVSGRELTLTPVPPAAAKVLDGSSPQDLGALVGRMAIERLGGTLAIDGESLVVVL